MSVCDVPSIYIYIYIYTEGAVHSVCVLCCAMVIKMHIMIHLIVLGLFFISINGECDLNSLNLILNNTLYLPGTKEYRYSVILANNVCINNCALGVVQPRSEYEIQILMHFVNTCNNYSVTVRGGGHGYNCDSMKKNSLLIDMRPNFSNHQINIKTPSNNTNNTNNYSSSNDNNDYSSVV